MKTTPNKFRLLALSLFVMISFAVNAQEDAAKAAAKKKAETAAKANMELILGLPKVSEKNLFIITETTEKIGGLVFIQFCEGHKLALFKYDQELFPKPTDVIKAFEEKSIRMPMLVKEGKFREDLYYRLSVVEIRVPPLRERWTKDEKGRSVSDVALLLEHFLGEATRKDGVE